jgi:predicted RNase H-like HicB family nuclease
LDLKDYLAIPYLLEAEAVESEPGKWQLRLAYPELTGCMAEGSVVEHVLAELERRRMDMIVTLVEQGKAPPVPRPPLASSDPLWIAKDLGVSERIFALLQKQTKQSS